MSLLVSVTAKTVAYTDANPHNPHAEFDQRTHRKVAKRNSADKRSEPTALAKRQKDARRSGGSAASDSKVAGNSGRIDVADRLEKGVISGVPLAIVASPRFKSEIAFPDSVAGEQVMQR